MDTSATTRTPPPSDLDTSWAETTARLRAFIARRVDDPHIAEDITQDVLTRSLAAGALDSVDNPAHWLYRAARNAVIDHYRLRRRHDTLSDVEKRWPDPEREDNQPNIATRELACCLRPLAAQLAPPYRDALTMVDLDGETHQGAAAAAGISVSGMNHGFSGPAASFGSSSSSAATCTPTAPAQSASTAPTSGVVRATADEPDPDRFDDRLDINEVRVGERRADTVPRSVPLRRFPPAASRQAAPERRRGT